MNNDFHSKNLIKHSNLPFGGKNVDYLDRGFLDDRALYEV